MWSTDNNLWRLMEKVYIGKFLIIYIIRLYLNIKYILIFVSDQGSTESILFGYNVHIHTRINMWILHNHAHTMQHTYMHVHTNTHIITYTNYRCAIFIHTKWTLILYTQNAYAQVSQHNEQYIIHNHIIYTYII